MENGRHCGRDMHGAIQSRSHYGMIGLVHGHVDFSNSLAKYRLFAISNPRPANESVFTRTGVLQSGFGRGTIQR